MKKYYPKKSLGQHFLRSQRALADIVDAAEIKKGDVVVEIGPGEGVLTEALLKNGARVIAIEKDSALAPMLEEQYAGDDCVIVQGDALELDWSALAERHFGAREYKVVANIPYYITGLLLRHMTSAPALPSRAVVLIQKEVAERIVARDGKESILSLSIKAYGEPKLVAKVPPGAFFPPPSVDSAILAIEHISRKQFAESGASEAAFFDTIKRGFASKRKKLSSNLELSAGEISDIPLFQQKGQSVRAEDVSLAEWLELSRALGSR